MIPIRIRGRVDVTKEYERLVLAASALDATHFVVLLRWGGGLRGGEMIALEWRDVESRQSAGLRDAVGLERPRDDTERRTAAVRAAHIRLAAALRGPPTFVESKSSLTCQPKLAPLAGERRLAVRQGFEFSKRVFLNG